MGDIPFAVDGKPIDWHDTVNYRGMMFTGVPNLVWVIGYFRASWTLRVDLLGDFVCSLLNHMDASRCEARRGCTARHGQGHGDVALDRSRTNFNPNYLMRDIDRLPRRGSKPEWRHNQDYWAEADEIPAIDLDGCRVRLRRQAEWGSQPAELDAARHRSGLIDPHATSLSGRRGDPQGCPIALTAC